MLLGIETNAVSISEAKRTELIFKARMQKKADMAASEYWDKVDQSGKIASHSAEEMFHIFKSRADQLVQKAGKKEFVIDDHNASIIKRLCLYFTKDPRSKRFGIDLNKGIMLAGNTGCGKTLIMKAFTTNMLQSYRMVRTVDVSYDFVEYGLSIVKNHGNELVIPSDAYGHTSAGICYDDMGNEDERRRYGDKVNVMADIISRRYDMLPFRMTHLTTNLNAKAIEDVYGSRIRSRMAEMFNKISFDNSSPDRRKS